MTKCQINECQTQANFSYDGEKSSRYSKHKELGMINVNAQKCDFAGCKTEATFGYEGEKATRCSKHKDDGMIDSHHKCDFAVCKATFGYEGKKTRRCLKHKDVDMIDVRSLEKEGEYVFLIEFDLLILKYPNMFLFPVIFSG